MKYLLVTMIGLLLLTSGVALAQEFEITCPDGIARATPTGEGIDLVCVPFTPTAGKTDVAPTATRAPPTATKTAVPTPVGDSPLLIGAGDIAHCRLSRNGDTQTAALLDDYPDATIFTVGDNAYPDGTLAQFNDCFGPTWGKHKARIRPAPGNHDYHTDDAAGYYAYFGAAAHPPNGYYSYDLGEWHIIVLNSEIDITATSPQLRWLREDLADNPKVCTLAYFHTPLFSSGEVHGDDTSVLPIWNVLYAAGADVVLNGHDHTYERFAPQNPDGQAEPDRGIRQFIVGTGGIGLYQFATPVRPNSEARNNADFGILKLTLHPTSYDWEFVPVAGKTYNDKGSANCVGADDTVPPGTPTVTAAAPTATATRTPRLTVPPTATGVPPTPTRVAAATRTPAAPGREVVAFPGAEGFGAQTVGGRGGQVYEVTNLSDSGAGSLRACVIASGPRTCIFRTGGTIELETTLEVRNPFLTIAGQTAPGGGIQLKIANPTRSTDLFKISTNDVIVRYLKFRPGTKGANARCISINAGGSAPADKLAHNIVIDHVSCSWAGDEVLIAWDRTNHISFQWNIFAESLTPGLKGPNLGKYGGGFYSFHHNLIAHHAYRTPNCSASGGPTDLVNNVIYNFRRFGARVLLGCRINIVNNYIEAGPDTEAGSYFVQNDLDVPDPDSNQPLPNPTTRGFFVQDNVLQLQYEGVLKIRGILPPATKPTDVKNVRYEAPAVSMTGAEQAYEDVLAGAGAIHGLTCAGEWYERPDEVDKRIVESVRNDTSSHNTAAPKTGYINSPADVGGWPTLATGTPCPDGDKDGMPDEWERLHGANPNADDGAALMPDGYTRLEHYLGGF
jgi:hypothetical protein